MFLLEDDQRGHAAESVAAMCLHAWHTANPTLPVLAPVGAGSGRQECRECHPMSPICPQISPGDPLGCPSEERGRQDVGQRGH